MRLSGLEENEQPEFITRNPTTKHHSVYFKENYIRLPLAIKGILSFLPTRKPTQEEYLNIRTRLELTPPFTEWDPHNPSYGIIKNCMLYHYGNINSNTVGKTLVGYKRGRPLPVPPRIRPTLPRGTQRVLHDGMPRQTLPYTRAVEVLVEIFQANNRWIGKRLVPTCILQIL